MSLNSIFDIAGSGMSAQTIRLNATASNLANAQSVNAGRGPDGEVMPYRARHPVFATALNAHMASVDGSGVRVAGIVESNAPAQLRYEPSHPMADDKGYVAYPNVNVVEEMANMISASRSFQLNVEIMNTAKTLAQRVLTLGQ